MTTATYLDFVTLTTGHRARHPRGAVAAETLDALRPWLDGALAATGPAPLPAPLAGYSAHALLSPGGLVITVYAHDGAPLTTFGTARRGRDAAKLWGHLVAAASPAPSGLIEPSVPWCAVIVHQSLALHPNATAWLADFEACVAWSWLLRKRGDASD